MGILSWIVSGLVIGVIAKLLTPGRDPGGFIVTILLGIAGAFVGGFLGRAMGFYEANQTRRVVDVHPGGSRPAGALPLHGSSPRLRRAPSGRVCWKAARPRSSSPAVIPFDLVPSAAG